MAAFMLFNCFSLLSDQVNPAVTLALLATRKLEVVRAVVYMAAQCLGASLGAGALYLALPVKTTADHFVNRVSLQLISGLPFEALETLHIFRIFLLRIELLSSYDQLCSYIFGFFFVGVL